MTSSLQKKRRIALFNYGGGMRGLIPAHFMAKIEETTGLRITEMVDIFTGPSTGAILNAALNVPHPESRNIPKYRARHMVKFYERDGINIFPPDRYRDFRALIHDFNNRTMKINQLQSLFRHGHYNHMPLSRALKELYGDAKLSDCLGSIVIPVYNLDGNHLRVPIERGETGETPVHTKNNLIDQGGYAVWLKNIQKGAHIRSTPDVTLHDAVMASAAAPTYFPCHHFNVAYHDKRGRHEYSGIDGSIFDNPCVTYHGAIRQHLEPDENLTMIILGTGHTLRSFKKEDWNRFGGLGVVDPVNDLPLINILFHASASALVESFDQELGDNVFVFNKSLLNGQNMPSTQIDDASPENIIRLQKFFEEMLEENKSRFDKICHLLVSNRDQRQVEEKESRSSKTWAQRLKEKLFPAHT